MLRERLLTEAVRIGDELIQRVKTDRFGTHWETLRMGAASGDFHWSVQDNLYSGTAGILLFFIELAKQTGLPRFLKVIRSGAEWLCGYSQNKETTFYAFYTGRIGVAYVLTEIAKLTQEDRYNQEALSLVSSVEDFTEKASCDDLLNGTAGTLLGLLHIYKNTGESKLLPIIERFTTHVIDHAFLADEGIYWDKSEKNIKGLCGFSHGVSGIASTFMELAHFFDNPAFYYLAEQAFKYENSFFSESAQNWPDFRKGIFDQEALEEHKAAYHQNDMDFFTVPNNMAAWCHGGPGIGHSRVRALNLIGKQYEEDLERALANTLFSISGLNPARSFTLCHGMGGNAILFIEAYRYYKEQKYLDHALKVAETLLEYKESGEIYQPGLSAAHGIEDFSLFMGNAGIGYFYLMCLEPINTPNILNLIINGNPYKEKSKLGQYPLAKIKRQLLKSAFPNTVDRLNRAYPDEFETWLANDEIGEELKAQFQNWVEQDETFLKGRPFRSAFFLDTEMGKVEQSIESSAHLNISRIVDLEESLKHLDVFATNPHGYVMSMAAYTRLSSEATGNEDPPEAMLIYATPTKILSFPLNPLSLGIVEGCRMECRLNDLIGKLSVKFDLGEGSQEEFSALIISQVTEMVKQGILVLKPIEVTLSNQVSAKKESV